ncbi:MFS transporter [Lentzea sp. E54]|uniref:MFS transporter n=1 Tax=Lentzea xerophila TaxID=3435883 RepID=UPI003DA5E1CF
MGVSGPIEARLPTSPFEKRRLALGGLAAVVGVVILDAAMVNLATPAIRAGLSLSHAELSWVVDGYLIAFAGLLLLGGRLADVAGGRRVFMAGLAVYVAASAMCALAGDGTVLIVARIVQGAGAAILSPAALSIVLGLYAAGEERRRVLGVWGGVLGAGSLLGVLLGGAVTQLLGWQAIFWLPVPLGVAVAVVVYYAVAPSPARPGGFDLPGAAAITVGISALALGLISAPDVGWSSPRTVVSLLVGVAASAAFVVIERRSAHPLVPLGILRRGPVVTGNVVMLLLGAVSVGLFFFLPQYQQHVLQMSPLVTGLSQLPIAVMITLGGFGAPWLARLVGSRTATAGAMAALLAGLLWLTLADADAGYPVALLGPFLLIGVGLGLGFVYATTVAVAGAAAAEAGLVSGLITAARQLGGALGLAALIAVATDTGPGGEASGFAYQAAFLGLAVPALAALALSLLPVTHRRTEAEQSS